MAKTLSNLKNDELILLEILVHHHSFRRLTLMKHTATAFLETAMRGNFTHIWFKGKDGKWRKYVCQMKDEKVAHIMSFKNLNQSETNVPTDCCKEIEIILELGAQ